MKLGLIHQATRPDNYQAYWEWVIRQAYPQHSIVLCMEQVGPHQFKPMQKPDCDVYVRLDDSFDFPFPATWRPLIYMLEDMHVPDGVDRIKQAKAADFVFCHQKNVVELLTGEHNLTRVEWLPHAAFFYPSANKQRDIDVASVLTTSLNPLFAERTWMAHLLSRRYGKNSAIGAGYIHENMAGIYSRAKVAWNKSLAGDLNMRVFEAAAAGAALVADSAEGQSELFGDAILIYKTVQEMTDRIDHLLKNPAEARQRGSRLANIAHNHSYEKRLQRVFEVAEEL
jgi:spore maturation protein CgeB